MIVFRVFSAAILLAFATAVNAATDPAPRVPAKAPLPALIAQPGAYSGFRSPVKKGNADATVTVRNPFLPKDALPYR